MKSERPLAVIPLTSTEWTIEVLSASMVLFTIIFLAWNYMHLPDTLPSHFDAKGNPDAYGRKSTIIILPILLLFIYALTTTAQRFPHRFNFTVDITLENHIAQYRNAILMVRRIKFIACMQLSYITYTTIETASGHMHGLGVLFLPLSLIALLGTITFYIVKAHKLR